MKAMAIAQIAHGKRQVWGTVLAALLLAACGGGGGDGGGDGGGPGSGGGPQPPSGSAGSVAVTPSSVQDYWGYDIQLSATARDASGAALSPQPTVNWASSDPSVAPVSSTGLLTARRPGSATVTARAGAVSGTATVTVLGFERLARAINDTNCGIAEGRQRIFCWGNAGVTAHPMIVGTPRESRYVAPTPIPQGEMPPGTRIAKVAVDRFHMCALSDAGAIYCWGDNRDGALGIGVAGGGRSAPTALAAGEVPAGVRMTDLALRPSGGCATGDNGRLYCWGSHANMPNAALPRGGLSPAPVAMPAGDVPAGVKLRQVAYDINVGCALGDDGRAYCWNNPTAMRLVPQGAVPANVKLSEIQIGTDLPCALADNGRIYCWGSGAGRRFGDGGSTFVSNTPPRAVADGAKPVGAKFTAFTVGGIATAHCATADDGKAYCWSAGYLGSLGDGDLTARDALVPVAVLDGEKEAGFTWLAVNCAQYTCSGLASDRRIYNWGSNQASMLSRDSQASSSALPLLVTRPTRP